MSKRNDAILLLTETISNLLYHIDTDKMNFPFSDVLRHMVNEPEGIITNNTELSFHIKKKVDQFLEEIKQGETI